MIEEMESEVDMQTLLIVEDEKMIRQGIKAMVQRSGVPVDNILECSNGEDAINLLSKTHVDVMFTDIRMQKMDGIELVRRVNEMNDKPLIVAISGYDDFTYAVEMLRNGVKEYLLKPVEREKIAEVLKMLNAELEVKNKEQSKDKELGLHQIRELIDESLDEEKKQLIINKYSTYFFDVPYQICIFKKDESSFLPDKQGTADQYGGIYFEDEDEGEVVIIKENVVKVFLNNEMAEKCAGLSCVHEGLAELSAAFYEASAMRKLAFIKGKTCVCGVDKIERANSNLIEKAKELLGTSERTKRVQLIGTDKTEDVIYRWKQLFKVLENGQIEIGEFSTEMGESLSQIIDVFRESVSDGDIKMMDTMRNLHNYESLDEYQNLFMDWLLNLNQRLGNRPDDSNIRQKIDQARQYIIANYNSDLNMAVVSNYVSMNYSLFSYSFKQYTGKNFVNYLKDIRIEKAKELLASTDLKIIEISQIVGYDNEKHFMKTFKAMCGVSPGEYRKNMNS
ncbi:response regulator [Butyrivibrio sp.]|uniref:response regulator transcription factor n=1 Tax=Butyrivibrio sp. TaxID=28121 RepID=UPI0025C0C5D0|nr:response regulator [Butyrivibrio sp.]MBQ9304469.1 response regulator [Butyrivibrio sp.]